jgi:hypothetical protein
VIQISNVHSIQPYNSWHQFNPCLQVEDFLQEVTILFFTISDVHIPADSI